ncbi:MAG: cobalamin-dependent protein [Peptococcaceae bacterium]|nr:cobalamin-dependent protein [Peptococcaceae bacterium]
MKLVLVALNARYTHTNLAIRCLRAALRQRAPVSSCEVLCREYTLQESVENIVGDIYRCCPDVVGFSCYIWNISQMTAVIRRLRLVCPEASFICGGPEVSFGAEEFLAANPEVDWVVSGEGEGVLAEFVVCCLRGEVPRRQRGLTGRDTHAQGKDIGCNGHCAADTGVESSWWVDPYNYAESGVNHNVEEDFSNRYVYVEASRGCPFQCAYCLSAGETGVRYMDVERLADVFGRLRRDIFSMSAGFRSIWI